MPFICWGAMAEPGHPHQRPHLVFVDPVMAMPAHAMKNVATGEPSLPMQMTGAAVGDPVAQPAQESTAPIGRSTPKLLIFMLVILLAGMLWQVVRIDVDHTIEVILYLFTKLPVVRVPTPPPRYCCFF